MLPWPYVLCLAIALVACRGRSDDAPSSSGSLHESGAGDAGGACVRAQAASELDVVTASGALRGARAGASRAFRGVPYAAPPIGPMRWRPPLAHGCWSDVREAVAEGAMCTQISPSGAVAGAEDCLTLDLWTPAASAGERLPVLFFIHGGDDIIGSASDEFMGSAAYDGQRLAERARAIVVVVQYRLAAFGFLDHPALSDEGGVHGNFGTLDQIAALGWVKTNIAAFGGDPARVTIFGQSAGADAVCALVASPRAAGLFAGAILHSGACHASSASVRDATARSTLHALGCDSAADVAACLRAKPAADVARVPGASLAESAGAADFYVTVDGVVLPDDPLALVQRGAHNRVPLVVLATRDEYLSLVSLVVTRPLASQADFEVYVRATFGPAIADFVIESYPTAAYPSASHAYVAALSDAVYHCPDRRILRALHAAQPQPAYRAIFASVFDDPRLAPAGAGHGIDLPYAFGNFGSLATSAGERALSGAIMQAWGAFAATGSPATATLPFATYDPARDDYLELDDVSTPKAAFHAALCDGWDRLSTAP